MRGVTGGLVSAVPGRGGPRRLPAQRADRRRRIGDTQELLARRGGPAADGAAGGGYDESRFLVLGGTLAGSGGCGGGGISFSVLPVMDLYNSLFLASPFSTLPEISSYEFNANSSPLIPVWQPLWVQFDVKMD